jgi:carboxyl-terminal processing protease
LIDGVLKMNKVKMAVLVIAIVLVTNTATFFVVNNIAVSQGSKVTVTREDYNLLKEFNKLFVVRDILKSEYVDKIDESKIVEGAVRGLAEGVGDPYTEYISSEEYAEMNAEMEGEYAGVGLVVTLTADGKLIVVSPIEGTPGEKAGIKSGDEIIGIDDKSISGKKLSETVSLMKGKPGTNVKLTIIKAGTSAPVEVTITRANIVMNPVKSEMLENKIGYMRISTFNLENVYSSFVRELNKLKAGGMKALVIDLRDNGGGLLDQCAKVADDLMGKGTIVYTIDNKGEKQILPSDDNKLGLPIAVLVNGGTASASEIVSGALKDTNTGFLVGTRTFGKGLVQTIIPLTWDKSAVKVTIARYYTPSGVCIQGKGIEPNIVIDLPEDLKQKTDLTHQEDVQLKAATDALMKQIK